MPAAAPSAPSRKGGHKLHSSSAGAAGGGGAGGDVPTLVLDNGADRLKVGFAGDPAPRFLMPNCTAKLKGQLQVSGGGGGSGVGNGKEHSHICVDVLKYCRQACMKAGETSPCLPPVRTTPHPLTQPIPLHLPSHLPSVAGRRRH